MYQVTQTSQIFNFFNQEWVLNWTKLTSLIFAMFILIAKLMSYVSQFKIKFSYIAVNLDLYLWIWLDCNL